MYLVEFTYDTYCQGTCDECRTTVLVPDARTFREATVAVARRKEWENARDFEDRTVYADRAVDYAKQTANARGKGVEDFPSYPSLREMPPRI